MYQQKSPVASKSRPLVKSNTLRDDLLFPLAEIVKKHRPLKRSPTYYHKKANPNENLWQRIEQSSSFPGKPPLKKMYVSGKKPNLSTASNFEKGRMRFYEQRNGHENEMKMEYISTPKRTFIVEDVEEDVQNIQKPRSQTFYSPRRSFEVEDVEDDKPKPRSQTFYSPRRSFEVEDVEDDKPKPRSQTFYSPMRSFEVEDVLSFGKRRSLKKKSVNNVNKKSKRKSKNKSKNISKKSVKRRVKKSVRNKKR